MDVNVINECSKRSLDGMISFPEHVMKLIANNVERYTANLIGLETTYFSSIDEIHVINLALKNVEKVAVDFNEQEIKNAISETQKGNIKYPAFLRRIMVAGCSHYEVFLTGKKVIYFGRGGSFHIEHFPK